VTVFTRESITLARATDRTMRVLTRAIVLLDDDAFETLVAEMLRHLCIRPSLDWCRRSRKAHCHPDHSFRSSFRSRLEGRGHRYCGFDVCESKAMLMHQCHSCPYARLMSWQVRRKRMKTGRRQERLFTSRSIKKPDRMREREREAKSISLQHTNE
jgi:hypothetical protein